MGSTIRVAVTGTNAGGNSTATATQTGVVAPTAPANTGLPTVSGTPQDTRTLSAGNGTWTGTPVITYTYQWRSCDSAGNAPAPTSAGADRRPPTCSTPADVGSTIRVS